jgi:hypothetical protein
MVELVAGARHSGQSAAVNLRGLRSFHERLLQQSDILVVARTAAAGYVTLDAQSVAGSQARAWADHLRTQSLCDKSPDDQH